MIIIPYVIIYFDKHAYDNAFKTMMSSLFVFFFFQFLMFLLVLFGKSLAPNCRYGFLVLKFTTRDSNRRKWSRVQRIKFWEQHCVKLFIFIYARWRRGLLKRSVKYNIIQNKETWINRCEVQLWENRGWKQRHVIPLLFDWYALLPMTALSL